MWAELREQFHYILNPLVVLICTMALIIKHCSSGPYHFAAKRLKSYFRILQFALFLYILIDAFRRLCTSPQPYERDECAYFGNLCKNGRCVDTQYSYRCDCYQGYKIDELGTECIGKHFSFDES